MPGIAKVQRGVIRIDSVVQVFNERDFKVWEITTQAKYVETSVSYGTGGYCVELSDYNYTIFRPSRKHGWSTSLFLDLDESRAWSVLVKGGRNEYTIVAYSYPAKNRK